MSIGFTVAGLDASATLLPPIEEVVYGFPFEGLGALYLCQDGSIGSAYTGTIADVSGYGHHGAQISGSGVKRIAAGLATIPAIASPDFPTAYPAGFAFDTGIAIDDSFSVVVVAKSNVTGPSAGFPTFWLPSTQGAVPITSTTGPHLNYELNGGGTSHSAGLFKSPDWAAGGTPSGATGRKYVLMPGAQTQRTAMAVSYDSGSGTWTIRADGVTSQWIDAGAGATLLGAGARHCFGYDRLGAGGTMNGELNLAVLYPGNGKSVAELDVLLAAARAEMARRSLNCI